MSLREWIEKAIRALRKGFDKDFPNPGALNKDQKTDGEFVFVTEEIDEHGKEDAVYGDMPDLEFIRKVDHVAINMEKKAKRRK